jgi:hypothetical protein
MNLGTPDFDCLAAWYAQRVSKPPSVPGRHISWDQALLPYINNGRVMNRSVAYAVCHMVSFVWFLKLWFASLLSQYRVGGVVNTLVDVPARHVSRGANLTLMPSFSSLHWTIKDD